ncbi:uncharacterized protein [Rutidosis leptorrhynchoides]|uniref:uncharacterized protein n=1 Tax=Rutidosis leptorrhynchoides TaxID=125765 RepID=UPI003A98E272
MRGGLGSVNQLFFGNLVMLAYLPRLCQLKNTCSYRNVCMRSHKSEARLGTLMREGRLTSRAFIKLSSNFLEFNLQLSRRFNNLLESTPSCTTLQPSFRCSVSL